MSTGYAWDASEDAALKDKWLEGKSGRAIAGELPGRSRSAVMGRLHRLGLSGAQPKRQSKPPRDYSRRVRAFRIPQFKKERTVEKAAPVEPLHIPFLQHQHGQCRAITDATRYAQRCCGHPMQGEGRYCAAHHALFYVPAKPHKGRGA